MHPSESSSDDDDFGPVIPPLKKERTEESPVTHPTAEPVSADPAAAQPATDGTPQLSAGTTAVTKEVEDGGSTTTSIDVGAVKKAHWDFFTYHSDLPCALLYERSYRHDRAAVDVNAGLPDATASSSSTTPATVDSQVEDVAVLEDGLGAMVCSVDAEGVLRVWRMLPSGGLFFLGEQDRFFPASTTSGHEEASSDSTTTRYHLCANNAMQWLILIRVAEEPGSSTAGKGKEAQATRDITVDVRRVNPLTLTVEAKGECAFTVPAVATHAGHMEGYYTRQPFLLQHHYEPHLAFFVGMPCAGAGGMPTAGLVLFPCFPTAASANERSLRGNGFSPRRLYRATRLSTANMVVACVQQPRDAGGASSPALVLVDERGIVDCATIEPVSAREEDATATTRGHPNGDIASDTYVAPTSGLTLRIIGGLKAVPAGDAGVLRAWARWVRFETRARTGFFSILRDVQKENATSNDAMTDAGDPATGGAHDSKGGTHVIPLSVSLSPTGRFFAVSCLVLSASIAESQHRKDCHVYAVATRQRAYFFDFPSGQCIASCDSTGTFTAGAKESREQVTLTKQPGQRAAEAFACYARQLAHRSSAGAMLMESGAVLRDGAGATVGHGLYMMTPQVRLTTDAAPSSGLVEGRPILAFQVSFPPSQQKSVAPAKPVAGCLPSAVGALEPLLAQWEGPPAKPPHAFAGASHPPPVPAPPRITAPLVILRRSVAPSQDLKNLLGRSRIGAALNAEELKKLVFTVSAGNSSGGGGAGAQRPQGAAAALRFATTDRLAVTTSPDQHALLVYVSPASAASPETSHLCAMNRSAAVIDRLLTAAQAPRCHDREDPEAEQSPEAAAAAVEALRQQWSSVRKEVRAQRDYRCARLLALSAQSLAQLHESAEADDEPMANATEKEGQEEAVEPNSDGLATRRDGQDPLHDPAPNESFTAAAAAASGASPSSSAPDSVTAPAALTPAEKEDAAVMALLQPVLPHLPPATIAGHHQPSAFFTVRGYGIIQVHFLPMVAPLAVRSFTALARKGYYTGLTFHRVIPNMMIQGGCPKGDGTGGESGLPAEGPNGGGGVRQTFPDENLDLFPFFSHTPEHQWLCMANAGPDTNGSQFFITVPGAGHSGSAGSAERGLFWLNGKHTVFGYVVGGASVIARMSGVPRDEQDKPLRPLVLERVDVL